MELVYDIGMYDGADTTYYLESGYRVVAVEANPALVDRMRDLAAEYIRSGQLTCINAAISPNGEPTDLNLCGADLGSSTLFRDRIAHRRPIGSITVPGTTLTQLFNQHGVPKYLKVDIEGADRFCILSLTSETKPAFVSFEIGADAIELLAYLASIGYTRFKIVNQNSFREFANLRCYTDRIALRLIRYMGYAEPRMVRRSGRFFTTGHSSGPVPWLSDGRWRSHDDAHSVLHEAQLPGWNDIHARI